MPDLMHESVMSCPDCGFAKQETMPAVSCQITYRCPGCGVDLWPAPGDCCVFCTYGSVPCPAIQQQRAQLAGLESANPGLPSNRGRSTDTPL